MKVLAGRTHSGEPRGGPWLGLSCWRLPAPPTRDCLWSPPRGQGAASSVCPSSTGMWDRVPGSPRKSQSLSFPVPFTKSGNLHRLGGGEDLDVCLGDVASSATTEDISEQPSTLGRPVAGHQAEWSG